MEFSTSAVGTLQTLVIALGAGLGIWNMPDIKIGDKENLFTEILLDFKW